MTLLAWLLLLCALAGAWHTSRQSELVPHYDVRTYVTKAENVWKALGEGNFTELLAVEPVVRPFGTALLGYPFGYDDDWRAYYWRTVAWPCLLGAAAGLLAAMAAGFTWRSSAAWLTAAVSGQLGMWWKFEPRVEEISMWGLVDSLQAGVAAVAAALLVLGWQRRRAWLVALSFVMAAATVLIKPSGTLITACHGLTAVLLAAWDWRNPRPGSRWAVPVGILGGSLLALLLFGWCFYSPYFSAENMEFGRKALEMLRQGGIRPGRLRFFVWSVPFLMLGTVPLVLLLCAWLQRASRTPRAGQFRVAGIVATMVLAFHLAVIFWQTYFLQARYAMPAVAGWWACQCPLLALLLQGARTARALVLLGTLILAASTWQAVPAYFGSWTGYTTTLSATAATTAETARKALASMADNAGSKRVLLLQEAASKEQGLLYEFLAHFTPANQPPPTAKASRVWDTAKPPIHPHEIAGQDLLIQDTVAPAGSVGAWSMLAETARLLRSPEARGASLLVAGDQWVQVRQPVDRLALESLLAGELVRAGYLDSRERGPQLRDSEPQIAMARYPTGDILEGASAAWQGDELVLVTTWLSREPMAPPRLPYLQLRDAQGATLGQLSSADLPLHPSPNGELLARTIVQRFPSAAAWRGKAVTAALGLYSYDLTLPLPPKDVQTAHDGLFLLLPIAP